MSPTVYLVSGANRGIGLGLVRALAAREDVVVFAGARSPDTARELQALVTAHPGKVHVVKLVSSDKAGNAAAVAEIEAKAGRLDVVIANAAILKWVGPSLEAPLEELREHFEVNVVGTLALFQASYGLLKTSSPTPKFVIISSGIGSITLGAPLPIYNLPYTTSKAAVNYVARKLHFEYAQDGLVVFPMCPGNVGTDMQAEYVKRGGKVVEGAPASQSVDETAKLLLERVDEATREKSGGQFVSFEGGRYEF